MRLLLLSDRSFATREHAMLRRLEIGLVDEGCRVVRLAPEGASIEPTTGLAAALAYPDAAWRVGLFSPAKSVERALGDLPALAADDDGRSIDIIHAFGHASWPLALALSELIGGDLVLEVTSRSALAQVQATERRAAPASDDSPSGVWLAPDDAMRSAVERLARRWPVRTAWWGVHVPPIEPISRTQPTPIESVCILSSGEEPASVINLLTALAGTPAIPSAPIILLDARAVEKHPEVWRHASALGLLPRLSVVSEIESRRQLVLRVDALIQADCRGEHASLVLEAMASGIPLVTRADRLVSIATDPSIAVLVEEPSEQGWARAITSLLASPSDARSLGLAARRYIQTHRLAHVQVRAALEAYAQFMEPSPIPMHKGRAG